MSAQAGWYPDPGGGQGLYRYWDGRAWSAATSPNPAAPPPVQSLGAVPPPAPATPVAYGQAAQSTGHTTPVYGHTGGQPSAYANYQAMTNKKRSPVGWWLGAAALLVVIMVVAAFVIRGITGGGTASTSPSNGQPTSRVCPPELTPTSSPPKPSDGRVHGGPVSYPQLGAPWSPPHGDDRVPFGSDVQTQDILVEPNYQAGSSWVASVLVGELAAGDGFFTPEQGSQIVVRCILGKFYGLNEVQSNVKVNRAATIDGHQAWLVESQLSFDIEGLRTKGELLIVAIVATGSTAGLFYASIPDTRPELVKPARDALRNLQVDD
ncbi:MAG TPA: DUF2510 domain-containing protein [Propionibacteriaceae bacterium]|nr:DUF2510 domain-containing protein [Propionibacteriaceae bacterium]